MMEITHYIKYQKNNNWAQPAVNIIRAKVLYLNYE